jgi:hypothetical protein
MIPKVGVHALLPSTPASFSGHPPSEDIGKRRLRQLFHPSIGTIADDR